MEGDLLSEVPITVTEVSDLPEGAVGCLEVRVPRDKPVTYVNDVPDTATVTLYVRPGFPHERLHEWVMMRLSTVGQGAPPDRWNIYEDGDEVVVETLVEWTEMPGF